MRRLRCLLLAALVAWVLALGTAWAAFSGTGTTTSTLSAKSSFPTYGAQVVSNGPSFYHQLGDAPSSTTGSTVSDASGNARPGVSSAATDGPTTYWRFEASSGTTVGDRSGTGNTGTITGAVYTSAGHAGQGLSFDGSGDYVAATNRLASMSGAYTFSAWVYLTDATAIRTVVSQPSVVAGTYQQSSMLVKWSPESSTTGHWELLRAGTSGAYDSTTSTAGQAAPVGQWVNLVATYDNAGTQALWVNGTQFTTASTKEVAESGGFQLGRGMFNGAYNPAEYFAGVIDDVRTYPRALSSNEIANLYAGRYDLPVTHWTFDDGTPGSALASTDASANGDTLNLSGATYTGSPTKVGRNSMAFGGADYGYGSTTPLHTDQSFSVSAWAAISDTTDYRPVLSQDATTTASSDHVSGWVLEYRNDYQKWAFTTSQTNVASPTQDIAYSSVTPTVSTSGSPVWYHLVVVYDQPAGKIRIYVNGAQSGSDVTHTTGFPATGPLQLGRSRWMDGYGAYFKGWIDDVQVFQRALSSSEVSTLYSGGADTWTRAYVGMTGAAPSTSPNQATAYEGLAGGYNTTTWNNPTDLSVECWFTTTSSRGGVLVELASSGVTTPYAYDRMLYLDSTGAIVWGTYNLGTSTAQYLRTSGSYEDGAWHHVVGTLSSTKGMALWVDGQLVGSNASWTTAQNQTSAVWRWGAGNTFGWPNRPTSDGFIGALDEIAVYPYAFDRQHVLWDYDAAS